MGARRMTPPPALPSVEPAPAHGGARTPGATEWFGVAGFFTLSALLAVRVARLGTGNGWWWIACAVLAGYVVSDFVSGLVHWTFDTWFSAETPVVGKTFVVPFRIHHVDPLDITRHGFIATNGHNCLAALPALVAALLLPVSAAWTPAAIAFVVALCGGVFATNQFHKWAHEDALPAPIRWAQRAGLILSREHHDIHHRAPYDTHYCITTGWLNRPLRAVGFYRRAEGLITRLSGAEPRKDDLVQTGVTSIR